MIGTYTLSQKLSILLYPVAEYNLETFLHCIETVSVPQEMWEWMIYSSLSFFSCLANALSFIHRHNTKHMDIKPSNILVRQVSNSLFGFKVYIADFVISRSYDNAKLAETDGATSFTRKYAAPEVIAQEQRGLSADVFSLACVFVEILTTLSDHMQPSHRAYENDTMDSQACDYYYWRLPADAHSKSQTRFNEGAKDSSPAALQGVLRTSNPACSSYAANIDRVRDFVWKRFREKSLMCFYVHLKYWRELNLQEILRMLDEDPKARQSDTKNSFDMDLSCCRAGQDALEPMAA
jgi:serine/threonine protein kinase